MMAQYTQNISSVSSGNSHFYILFLAFPFGTMRVEIYYDMKNSQFPWGTVTIDIDWQESIVPPGELSQYNYSS